MFLAILWNIMWDYFLAEWNDFLESCCHHEVAVCWLWLRIDMRVVSIFSSDSWQESEWAYFTMKRKALFFLNCDKTCQEIHPGYDIFFSKQKVCVLLSGFFCILKLWFTSVWNGDTSWLIRPHDRASYADCPEVTSKNQHNIYIYVCNNIAYILHGWWQKNTLSSTQVCFTQPSFHSTRTLS